MPALGRESPCSCENISRAERCGSSPLAFTARVVEVTPEHGTYQLRLQTIQPIRGDVPEQLTMSMGIHRESAPPDLAEHSCQLGRHFPVDTYLEVFLDHAEQRAILVCTHAAELASLQEARADRCDPRRVATSPAASVGGRLCEL